MQYGDTKENNIICFFHETENAQKIFYANYFGSIK